jgi:hypothetical protein
MPIDRQALARALRESHAKHASGPTAVRTGGVIAPLHYYCVEELVTRGLPRELLHPRHIPEKGRKRIKLLGGYMPKEVDVCLTVQDSGPLLAISVKSQMSSIVKNTINRFEEYVGDATNLHSRYPMLVLGFMMLVLVRDETYVSGQPTDGLQRIAALLERSNARRDVSEPVGSYEVSCLLLVDYGRTPPRLVSNFPPPNSSLRIDNFFDKLLEIYRDRNQFVKL